MLLPKQVLKLPAAKTLRKHLSYDPATGVFTRLTTVTCAKAGTRADRFRPGGREGNDYCVVSVDGGCFHAHRIAWKMMTGKDPLHQIDHINNVSTDNRWSNLRAATNCQNQQNKRLQKNNSSGFKGVHWDYSRAGLKNWTAGIKANGKWFRLGRFYTPEEARCAVETKRLALHGEFARPN